MARKEDKIKGNTKKRKSPLPLIISAVIVGAIVICMAYFFNKYSATDARMDASQYFAIHAEDEAALIVNDEELKDSGRVVNGTIYISYTTVWDHLNGGFYWDEGSSRMLLTLPAGTKTWTENDGTGAVILIDGAPYISADCVRENSDIDMEIYTDPNRIVARTKWEDLNAGTITKDTELRYRGGPKSEILLNLQKGDSIVILDKMDSWTHVSTTEGYIGYVRSNTVEDADDSAINRHTTDQKFIFPRISLNHKINMSWQYVDSADDNDNFTDLTANATGLNVISPMWFQITDQSGTVQSFATKEYVNTAHNAGMDVWALLGDVNTGSTDTVSVLKDSDTRSHIIDQIMSAADATGLDGINVDFEALAEDGMPQFLQFLKELSVAAHERNLVVSVDNYVPSYTSYYKRGEQAKCVDYIVIMGYDEHMRNSTEAGSVASLPFVRQGIEDTLKEVPASQVINAVPFYTRGWVETFGASMPTSSTLGMNQADAFVKEHDITISFDEETGENTGSAEDEEARYSIWLEDETALEEKMKLIQEYDLAGVASWRLGYQRSSVWEIIQSYLN